MPSEPHHALRDYVGSIRSTLALDDPFGQQLARLIYRSSRASARGIFRHVRDLHDAVIATGGTLADARAWTFQAIRWWRTGKPVEHKYARLEVDPHACQAMEALLRLLQSLPDDMLQPTPQSKPLSRPPFSFGSRQSANQPATQPGSPFGGSAQRTFNPATNAQTTPNSANPPNPPNPPPPQQSLFGSRQAQLQRNGGQQQSGEALPFHVNVCFDALAVKPDDLPPIPADPLSWLTSLANNNTSAAPANESSAPSPQTQPLEDLPDDLKGLLDRWHRAVEANLDPTPILRKIGLLDDMRALDHIHRLRTEGDDLSKVMATLTAIGCNVGIAGLIALLPLDNDRRAEWLWSLCAAVRRARRESFALSDASLDAVWKIAVAESAPNVVFCPAAINLLAATGRRESFEILWEHARSPELERRRVALHALAQADPGTRLPDLLAAIGDLPDPTPRLPFGATFQNRFSPPPPEPSEVGIPYERLEAAVLAGKINQRISALYLLGFVDDPHVEPFLVTQLSRRVLALRETALKHLQRRKATQAADAVAALMHRDAVLRLRCAETLREWGDPRGVPPLLEASMALEPNQVIELLGKLPHPAFDKWLMDTISTLEQQIATEAEDALVGMIETLIKIESRNLQTVLEKLIASDSIKVRRAVADALGKLDYDWAREGLRALVLDPSPLVSYRAVALCSDVDFARQLVSSRSEVQRVIAVRLLWAVKDIDTLLGCLSDKSAAVRNCTIWALSHITVKTPDVIDALYQLVEHNDRVDLWNQNPAVLAWRGLAKTGHTAQTEVT